MNTIGRDYLTAIETYEAVQKPLCDKDPWRLGFHIMPPAGWLNDPNGLCWFDGRYYVFFQYSPFTPRGGMKCWGLYTSTDLVNWEYQGVKLCPDEVFDAHGVYSGSALVEDGVMTLFYTGNVKKVGDFNYVTDGREGNTVCAETRDGVHFEQKELLMTNEDYGGQLTCHVRDPKVWKENGRYYMVQGARTVSDVGEILVFESEDKKRWRRIQVLRSEKPLGFMWECPDMFELDGKRVLCFSPQGVEADGDKYQNVYQSGYCFLDGDFKGDYSLGEFEELDRGFDYYAPQSFLAPDGRRIQIGWMGLPDIEGIYENPTVERGWQHAMTLPRELSVADGRLRQQPVRELEALRKQETSFAVSGETRMSVSGGFELWAERAAGEEAFELQMGEQVLLWYLPEEKKFELKFLDRSGEGRDSRKVRLDGLKNIRMFVDTSSIEVFLNDGEEVFTTRYYPENQETEIAVRTAEGLGKIWKLYI